MNKPEGIDIVDYVNLLEKQLDDKLAMRAEDTLNILFRMACVLERLWEPILEQDGITIHHKIDKP